MGRARGWGGLRWNEAPTAERAAGRRVFTAGAAEGFGSHGTSAGSCSGAFSPAGFKGHRGTGSSSAALPHASGRTLAAATVTSFPVRRQTGLPSVCVRPARGKRGEDMAGEKLLGGRSKSLLWELSWSWVEGVWPRALQKERNGMEGLGQGLGTVTSVL